MSQRSSWMAPYGSHDIEDFDPEGSTVEQLSDELSRLASGGALSAARALTERAQQMFPNEARFERWLEVLAPPTVVGGGTARRRTTGEQVRRWLDDHGTDHIGRWVIIDGEHLVTSGATLEEVQPELTRRPDAVAVQVLEELVRG